MKAQVRAAFRYHRLDNTHVDLKPGDVVEADDIPFTQRQERLLAGHLVAVEAAAKPEVRPEAAEPQEIARVKAVAPKGKK